MNELFSLEGRTAVVTGASRGIGNGIAEQLRSAGVNVIGVSTSRSATDLHSDRQVNIAADLSQRDQVRQLPTACHEVIAEQGWEPVSILINNAGIIRRSDALDFSEDDWDEVLEVDLTAAFLLAQAFAREMVSRGMGSIVFTASLLSFQGGIRVPAYTAAKSAIRGLVGALANEWAPHGVNVNGVAPGYIVTDNTEALRNDPERFQQILERIPAGRWGTPEDLVGAVHFLCSPAARYIHGQVLAVDGGWLTR